MMTNKRNIFIFTLITGIYLFSSCSPVNYRTKVKKIPQNYSINYNYGNLNAELSELNDKVWIVYSDRMGNATTVNPGGSLQYKKLGFMEPLLVIGRKGDFYKLIKYDPAILKIDRLVNRKEAEFYGWIHKDLLLLYDNPFTEVRNDIKMKDLATITDCNVLLNADKKFIGDSLILFSNPKLTDACGSIALNSIVFSYKTDEFGTSRLISAKSALDPDDLENTMIGWVDASLISPFGQRMVFGNSSQNAAINGVPGNNTSPVSVTPALYAQRQDSSLVYRTLNALEILDHSDNRIYNVNGDPISYEQASLISSNLKKINVIFGIIPTENVMHRLPMISNAVQNLKPVFTASPKGINFSYAAVIGGKTIDFEKNYLSFTDKFIDAGISITDTLHNDYETMLRSILSLAAKDITSTNVIILIGEKALDKNDVSEDIKKNFVKSNARLLSYQVYADNNDAFNNFVLRSLDLIEYYADEYRTYKRDLIVYPDQLRTEYSFLESAKNAFSLDFPTRSITQGMVIFPEKGRYSDTDMLIASVDTLVNQVVDDNLNLVNSINMAFEQVGHHRSRLNESITTQLGIDPQTRTTQLLGSSFHVTSPQWVQVSDKITLPLKDASKANFGLLLTGDELDEIKKLLDQLVVMKPDRKGEVHSTQSNLRHVRNVRRDLRGESPDIAFTEVQTKQDDPEVLEYASTAPIRKNLYNVYQKALKNYVFDVNPRSFTLAQAQEFITTLPTLSPMLNNFTIRDLENKRKLSDRDLDVLIEHFDKHRLLIEEKAILVEDLSKPDGEKYYFLPMEAMP